MVRSRFLLMWSCVICVALSSFVAAQDSVETALADLKAVQENEGASIDELQEAITKVQLIIDNFPASDAAVSILLGESYDGIVFAAFEDRLKAASDSEIVLNQAAVQSQPNDKEMCLTTAVAEKPSVNMLIGFSVDAGGNLFDLPEIIEPESPSSRARLQYLQIVAVLEECAPYANKGDGASFLLKTSETGILSLVALVTSPAETDGELASIKTVTIAVMPVGSERMEQELNLSKQAIRDIQTRLLVIGHDPNGVDGAIGNGTRSAIRAWQATVNTEPTGYLNESQLLALKKKSQTALDEWLQDSRNRAAFKPQPKRKANRKAKKRVRLCKRNIIGLLYDCRIVYR